MPVGLDSRPGVRYGCWCRSGRVPGGREGTVTREEQARKAADALADAIELVSRVAGWEVGDPYADAMTRWEEDGWPATRALIHALHN